MNGSAVICEQEQGVFHQTAHSWKKDKMNGYFNIFWVTLYVRDNTFEHILVKCVCPKRVV